MSLTTLIDKNIAKAFRLMKDLTKTATLVRKNDGNYNFSNAMFAPMDEPSVQLKVIQIDSKRKTKDSATVFSNIIFQSKDVDMKQFDKIIINGTDWRIGKYILNNGFTNMFEIYRETT